MPEGHKVKATLYSLRKYLASEIVANGASVKELQLIMGWRDVKTPLKHYVHAKPDKQLMDKYFAPDLSKEP